MIRALTPDDLDAAAAIEADAARRFDTLPPGLALPTDATPGHELVEALQDGLAFGFEERGALVGFLYGSVVGDAAFIEEVSVRCDASGRGIGAALIDRFSEAAAELGLASVLLTTFRDVPWNAPYYARLGFVEGGGSRGATLLSSETTRGFDEDQRVAMQRPVPPAAGLQTRVFTTDEAPEGLLDGVHALVHRAFGSFDDHDWEHALGGLHVVLTDGDTVVAHASGVPRTLWFGASERDAGYVEAVAVDPALQGRGLGTRVMRALQARLRSRYDLLALSSHLTGFYARFGWRVWTGPTFVMREDGPERTRDEDGGVMVLDGLLPLRRLDGPLGCGDRPGDAW